MDDHSSYLRDIAEFPDFRDDPGRTSDLLDKTKSGDETAKLSLMESTLKYIVALTRNHCDRWSAWPNYRDLVQEANTEVLATIEFYDPTLAPLEAYIRYRSYVAFVRFWHRAKIVQITDYGRKILRNLRRAQRELTAALDREPTLEELSQRVARHEAEVQDSLAHPGVTILAIGSDQENDDEGVVNLDSLISAEPDAVKQIEALELREVLVQCLGEKDADLLLAYYDSTLNFRELYFQHRHKKITAVAARKVKERLLKKLKKCPPAIVKLNRGDSR